MRRLAKESRTVLGLSFHETKPWILIGLKSGAIEIWDYNRNIQMMVFQEHKGAVRGIDFHSTEPYIVSGGDDAVIKFWSYEVKNSLFMLREHGDSIRTVQFHQDQPWILSASEDRTIRIWNWNSSKRGCIAVLNGHTQSVRSALFHPKEDLVVSASWDRTVRVWDIGALRTTVSRADDIPSLSHKYLLDGHSGKVNWASFHPTEPRIVSGADNGVLKIWEMNDNKTQARERGPYGLTSFGNVSCVLYSRQNNIVYLEDERIRVLGRTINTMEDGRFWSLSAHPMRNIFAAGHDSGFNVFKLERERPAFSVGRGNLLYVRDGFLRDFNFSTRVGTEIIPIKEPGGNRPCTLSSSPFGNAFLICSDKDGGSYELYAYDAQDSGDAIKGSGGSAVFVSPFEFAVLEKHTNRVLLKDLENATKNEIVLPIPTEEIFSVGYGSLLCRAKDEVVIFDFEKVLGILETSSTIRYVVWSSDLKSVALLSKHAIIIADKELRTRCTVHEAIRVKSGAWNDNGVFIYSTLTHLKYCLPNGKNGILKTLDVPIYIVKICGDEVFHLDRNRILCHIVINSNEYVLKSHLLKTGLQFTSEVMMGLMSDLPGQAIIDHLEKTGFPDLALRFETDEKKRLSLALKYGNIQAAVEIAENIDEKYYWSKLGNVALLMGNTTEAEYAYQKAKNFERLSFLYAITGQLEKLSKMMKAAEAKNDVRVQFYGALYLGNIKERVKILEDANHLPLAHMTASVHGLAEDAERIGAELKVVPAFPQGKTASLLVPPKPILSGWDWPMVKKLPLVQEGEGDAPPLLPPWSMPPEWLEDFCNRCTFRRHWRCYWCVWELTAEDFKSHFVKFHLTAV